MAGSFFQRWSGGELPPNVQANALGGSIAGAAGGVRVEEEGVVNSGRARKLVACQTVFRQGTGGVSWLQLAHAMARKSSKSRRRQRHQLQKRAGLRGDGIHRCPWRRSRGRARWCWHVDALFRRYPGRPSPNRSTNNELLEQPHKIAACTDICGLCNIEQPAPWGKVHS